MPRRAITLLAAAALAACAAPARTTPPAPAAGADAPGRGDATLVAGAAGARLDRYLDGAARFGFSGAVLVADSTGVVLRKGYGLADRARGTPITPRTLFDMGSIVKQFTAAAILLLEAEGRLSVRDSLGRHFPGVPADKAGITLHHLLTHSAGIVDPPISDYDHIGRDSLIAATFAQPLGAPVGKQFIYSNTGFSLLAAVIERVTGTPYERHVHDRLFAPAGMVETGYTIPRWDPARVARTYTPPVDHDTPLARLRASRGPWWMLMGNGGMLTTVGDLYRWERALRAGAPLPPALQARQFAPQFERGPTLSQGYDWWIERTEGDGVMYHRGGDAGNLGLNAEYRRYPADGTTIILLANTRHNGASTRRFAVPALRRVLTGDRPPSPPAVVPGTPASLARWAGTYALDSASRLTVTVEGDHLALRADGQDAVDLLVFNRDSTSRASRRALGARAATFVDALRGPAETLLPFVGGDTAAAGRMRGYWADAERRHGAFRAREVLGTTRLDRGVFLTTVRLAFARDTVAVRFGWGPQQRPTVDGDDLELPRFAGFVRYAPVSSAHVSWYWWPTGRANEIVTYDLVGDRELRASFVSGPRDGTDALVVHVPGGDVTLRRVR